MSENRSTSVRQAWYDDNRRRFSAETTITPRDVTKCTHTRLQRVSATAVQCACGAGWIDNGRWKIENGEVA